MQKGLKVAYSGVEGAFAHIAAGRIFPEGNRVACRDFKETYDSVVNGENDVAVLPIENSTAGIVNEIYDLLTEFENYIVGEQIIKIEHCLMVVPGTKKEDIKTVYSHPQSLAQSSNYLSKTGWQQIGMKNNAFAAQKVKEDSLTNQAAIAGEVAAKIYGLEILEKGVNDLKDNSTRFIIVTNQKICTEAAQHISICFEIAHESGSLYHILSHFIYNNINMTNIQSRPIKNKNWEYRFFVDIEGSLGDSAVMNALHGIEEEAVSMKILGTY
jgi:chorismate mutase/prephenate dehydratase